MFFSVSELLSALQAAGFDSISQSHSSCRLNVLFNYQALCHSGGMFGTLGTWNKKMIRLKILCYFDIQKFLLWLIK